MLIVSLIAVVGTLCWLVFTFAVYAVPAFVGLSVAMFAHQTCAGMVGAAVTGLLAGVVTLAFGQWLIASARTPLLRYLIAVVFTAPAGVVGFHAVCGVADMGVPDPIWRTLLALLGGAIVAATAWSRFGAPARQALGGTSIGTRVADF